MIVEKHLVSNIRNLGAPGKQGLADFFVFLVYLMYQYVIKYESIILNIIIMRYYKVKS